MRSGLQIGWRNGRWALWILAVVLAGCASGGKPRPQPLGPVSVQLPVRTQWTTELGAVNFGLEVPVVGNVAYVADSAGHVAALRTDTGASVWRADLAVPITAGVGTDGHYAAVVGGANELMVLQDGKLLWHQRLSALTLTAPLVAGERVFTVSADRTVSAFDAATGQKLWSQQRNADPLVLNEPGLLLAVRNTLVAGMGGRVLGMDPLNGTVRWETPVASSRGTNEVERLSDVLAGYSRVGNQICVRAYQYAVACLDGVTGTLDWSRPANGLVGISGDADAVFGTESDGSVRAWRRSNGELLWDSSRLRLRRLGAPLLVGQALVLADDAGNLFLLSRKDAGELNRLGVDGSALAATPVLAGKYVLLVTRRGAVLALRAG